MIKKQVLPKQSILDFTLQHSGNIEQLFDIMKTNKLIELPIDDSFNLYIPQIVNTQVVDFYIESNKQPSSYVEDLGAFSNGFSNGFK